MDKYTVDLDKVLNDFEYSELTDNFGTAKTFHAQTPSSYASSSKSKTGEVKHSITNVFHSLNEYLNTDISSSNTTTRVQLDNKENYFPPRNSFVQSSKKGRHSIVTADKIVDPVAIDNNSKEVELNVSGIDATGESNRSEVATEDSNAVETLLDLTSDETDESVVKEFVSEKKSSNIESLLDLDNIEPFDGSNSEITHNLLRNSGTNIVNTVETDKNTKTEVPNLENTKEEISHHNINESIEDEGIENDKTSETTSDSHNSEDESEKEEIRAKHSHNEIEGPPEDVIKEVVSFDNALDIDDSALNEYLDELECEYQGKQDDKQVSPNQNPDTTEKIEEAPIPEAESQSKEDFKNEEKVCDDVKDCAAVEEEVVIPSIEIEVSVVQDSTVSESEPSACDDSTKTVEGKEAIETKDGESASSTARPKMLEITADTSEEAPKREINLIGNPGSTPYNNVYISKELQTASLQKVERVATSSQEDESETSPSVSPTFSEASTEVLTDSSESGTEDDDLRTDTKAQKQKDATVKPEEDQTAAPSSGDTLNASDLPAGTANQNPSNSIELDSACATGSGDTDVQPTSDPGNQSAPANVAGFWLGKEAPLWIPDSDALCCLHCDSRFTVIKRRHHCRACGLVLCSKCCNLKYRLEYLDAEARVCSKCYVLLNMDANNGSGSEAVSQTNSPNKQPNPNNPMEYCSVVPPMQQVGSVMQNSPTVMVPVGVLKRKGSSKNKSGKSVMFCDGIRPGSDLAKLDTDFNYAASSTTTTGTSATPAPSKKPVAQVASKVNRNVPAIDPQTRSFISSAPDSLPPTVTVFKSDITYIECVNGENIVETLKCEKLTFALQRNLHVHLKIINMDCCTKKNAWCFSTEGLISVGQDEIVYVIELMPEEKMVPVDIFHHINSIYNDAVKGTTVTEMGLSLHNNSNFLGFKNHAGFLYIRPTFQCLQNLIRPSEPYLIGLLIHRWETPWAKIFPLRLVLRLGAEYRYYPSPIISTRHRDSVFVEIGHTVINILADFRNFSYTLPSIRGLTIHMEDNNTTVTIPQNRYDQVVKSLSNSSDHILAFGGNFSTVADSHLVCVQDTQASSENSYTTHAINILNKPKKVTGASFIVFNGALKSSSGLTAKSSIIEDGLMVKIPPEDMNSLRESLRNMKNYTIQCGCVNAPSDETVNIVWGEADTNFNIGVTSPIDNEPLSGVPSIRVHNGKDFICSSGNRLIRWTEVFILQNTDELSKAKDPVDISKISECIAKATCQALVKYLDLLSSNNFYKIGIRTTLHVENVSYSAGCNNIKLPPIYMKNLDNELIPVLHRITSNNLGDSAITLELIFRILNT